MTDIELMLDLSGGILEFFGIGLVAAPIIAAWSKWAEKRARNQVERISGFIRRIFGIKRVIFLSGEIHAKSQMRASAFVFRDVTQPTAVPIPRLERAVELLQEQMREISNELAPRWLSDAKRISRKEIARLQKEEIDVLKTSVWADLSLPGWRQAGVGILLVGTILTIFGNILALATD